MKRKVNIVQVRNLYTGRYVKIDRSVGVIISHKASYGPYKGVLVVPREEMAKVKLPEGDGT